MNKNLVLSSYAFYMIIISYLFMLLAKFHLCKYHSIIVRQLSEASFRIQKLYDHLHCKQQARMLTSFKLCK